MSIKDYQAPWFVDIFHSFPHLDLTFQKINSTFNPENPRYRESLLFWAAIPVIWLLVTLLVFLMYFCYRCCQKDQEKKQRAGCLTWSMAILAIIACGAIGVGFYGNEDAHKGVLQFATAGEDADDTVHYMQHQITELQDNIDNTIDKRLGELKKLFQRHRRLNQTLNSELQKLTNTAMSYTQKILKSVKIIDTKAQRVNLAKHVGFMREYGYWRWVGTILLFCWEVLLFLLLLLGIGKSSKCTLLMFCAFGIFTLVLVWVAAGLHLGVSVGLGDFCHDPDVFFERLGSEDIDRDIVTYYIRCNNVVTNPFRMSLKEAQDSVTSANNTLTKAVNLAEKAIPKSEIHPYIEEVMETLDKTVENIQQLTALVECTNLHKDYIDAVEGACFLALPGVIYILLSSLAVGFLLTLLVLLASCAWRHFGRKGYQGIDDDDPFLPRNDNASPSYYSFPRGRSNPREHVPMHRRSSPPPAYSTNEFYRQYTDMNPGMEHRSSSSASNA